MCKVKTLHIAFVILLCLAPGAGGAEPDGERPLSLTAEVVGRRHCAGAGADILQLDVRLRYRNTGDRKLIVYRGKNLFYQTRIRGGAGARPYEVLVTNSRFNDAEAEDLGERRPGSAFVTLRPGATYETTIAVGVGVRRGAGPRGANTVEPGEHTLQVVASSWYDSRRLAEELRGRWRESGLLWIDPVHTPPLAFEAGGQTDAVPCR